MRIVITSPSNLFPVFLDREITNEQATRIATMLDYEYPTGCPEEYPDTCTNDDCVDYSMLPEHMQDGAKEYVEHGLEPGGFLSAVLSNDLVDAYGKADGYNFDRMHVFASWLYNEAPSDCWGSREKVDAWIKRHEVTE